MLFELRNETGDTLRLEVPAGKFRVAHDVELEGIPAPALQPSREELQAAETAQYAEEKLAEQRKRWSKTPKRSRPGVGGSYLSYWDPRARESWIPYKYGEIPMLQTLPNPTEPGWTGPPADVEVFY